MVGVVTSCSCVVSLEQAEVLAEELGGRGQGQRLVDWKKRMTAGTVVAYVMRAKAFVCRTGPWWQ